MVTRYMIEHFGAPKILLLHIMHLLAGLLGIAGIAGLVGRIV